MGRLLLHDGDNSGAALYFDEALQIFLDQKDIFNESRSRRGLYEALRQTDPEQAMAHNDRYNQLRDSIFDNETGMMPSQYSAQLDNEHLQAEKDELRNQHRRNLYLAFAVVVILAVATWVFSYRRQHRYQRRMTELTDEITRIHQQVADIKLAAEPQKPDFTDQQFLIDVITNVNEAMQQGTFSVESIAGKMSLSPATLRRRLQQVTGEKPKAYFTAIQMQKAVSLLQQGSLSVNEVAEKCGFNEPSSFTRTFKRTYGVAPSQYVPPTVAEETEQPNPEET
jgi:AraC-like DNA-binding protein